MDGICASLSVVKLVSDGFARGSREATVTVMFELNRVLVPAYESALESPSNTLGGVIQIASQLGADFEKDSTVAIISEDTGYEAVKDYWEQVSPTHLTVLLGKSIEEVLLQLEGERGDYMRAGLEKIPLEAYRVLDASIPNFKETKKEETKEEEQTEEPSNEDQVLESLVDVYLNESAIAAYRKCRHEFPKNTSEAYGKVKKLVTPHLLGFEERREANRILTDKGEDFALKFLNKTYGKAIASEMLSLLKETPQKKAEEETKSEEKKEEVKEEPKKEEEPVALLIWIFARKPLPSLWEGMNGFSRAVLSICTKKVS